MNPCSPWYAWLEAEPPKPKNLGIASHNALLSCWMSFSIQPWTLALKTWNTWTWGSRQVQHMSWSQCPRPPSAPTAYQLVYFTMAITPLPSRIWNPKRIHLLTVCITNTKFQNSTMKGHKSLGTITLGFICKWFAPNIPLERGTALLVADEM